jgi:hypothetical protein
MNERNGKPKSGVMRRTFLSWMGIVFSTIGVVYVFDLVYGGKGVNRDETKRFLARGRSLFRGKSARDRRLAFRARTPIDLEGIGINTNPQLHRKPGSIIHFSRGIAEPNSYQMVMRDPRRDPKALEESDLEKRVQMVTKALGPNWKKSVSVEELQKELKSRNARVDVSKAIYVYEIAALSLITTKSSPSDRIEFSGIEEAIELLTDCIGIKSGSGWIRKTKRLRELVVVLGCFVNELEENEAKTFLNRLFNDSKIQKNTPENFMNFLKSDGFLYYHRLIVSRKYQKYWRRMKKRVLRAHELTMTKPA